MEDPVAIDKKLGSLEVAVSRVAAGSEEMDYADPSLARSTEPLHDLWPERMPALERITQ
jgi:hypothetical protein